MSRHFGLLSQLFIALNSIDVVQNSKKISVVAHLPTMYGVFDMRVWPATRGQEPFALMTPNMDLTKPILVRIHSECMTGDTFGSYRCDCGPQKDEALRLIAKSKNGLLIYLRQEGRGIGLYEKIRAYHLQESGLDTHEANIRLGHKPDEREYSWVKHIFHELGIKKIDLLTNNPSKVSSLSEMGIEVSRRVPLIIKSNIHNKKYLESKKSKFKHVMDTYSGAYSLGVSGVEHPEQIKKIGEWLNGKVTDPMLSINIGIPFKISELSDHARVVQVYQTAVACMEYPRLIPVLHVSFKHSKDVQHDVYRLKQELSCIRHVQLNDLGKNDLNLIRIVSKNFHITLPFTNRDRSVLLNADFVSFLRRNQARLLLDDSRGLGLRKDRKSYIKTINACLAVGLNDIALAGGFGPDFLTPYSELKEYFKINFSIDAETHLRTDGKLDIKKVKLYLQKLLSGV
jgi:3,4-dihydroxy 2-butanone 4-phosphate synthase/GTP cyclohydrolase II